MRVDESDSASPQRMVFQGFPRRVRAPGSHPQQPAGPGNKAAATPARRGSRSQRYADPGCPAFP